MQQSFGRKPLVLLNYGKPPHALLPPSPKKHTNTVMGLPVTVTAGRGGVIFLVAPSADLLLDRGHACYDIYTYYDSPWAKKRMFGEWIPCISLFVQMG